MGSILGRFWCGLRNRRYEWPNCDLLPFLLVGCDLLCTVAVSSGDRIYLSGYTFGASASVDMFLVEYDSLGAIQSSWVSGVAGNDRANGGRSVYFLISMSCIHLMSFPNSRDFSGYYGCYLWVNIWSLFHSDI